MRGRRQTLGDGHFDETGIWVPDLKSAPLSEDSLKSLERGDESGNSLLKSQGLFARKRREASEQDKIIPVANKSGRFGNDRLSDVKGKVLVRENRCKLSLLKLPKITFFKKLNK